MGIDFCVNKSDSGIHLYEMTYDINFAVPFLENVAQVLQR